MAYKISKLPAAYRFSIRLLAVTSVFLVSLYGLTVYLTSDWDLALRVVLGRESPFDRCDSTILLAWAVIGYLLIPSLVGLVSAIVVERMVLSSLQADDAVRTAILETLESNAPEEPDDAA